MRDRDHMSRGIIPWFATNPVAANLLLILVIALGIFQLKNTQKEAFPSIEPDSLTISVEYISGSAQQSEEGIATKIEDQLEGTLGIKTVTSTSTGTGVTVTVEKQSEYDLDTLFRDVKTKVDGISTFPTEAKKPVIEKAEREEHALWIQLHGDTDRYTLQRLADSMKTDLLSQAAINKVTISGWLDPMMTIEINETQLQAYSLTLSDVEDIVNQYSSNTKTAVLRNDQTYLQLKASEQAYLKEDFAAIPLIKTANGDQIRLGDVAKIQDTYDDTSSSLLLFQGQPSVGVQVITTGKDDISRSVAAAQDVVAEWRTNPMLPANVSIDTWYDRSVSITQRLQLLIKNAATGIALVFLLLAVFLNLRVAFWVAAGLPFIFFGTIYFMGDQYVGLSLNEFTTFGFIMALGIVVDDAVVVGESVYAVRREKGDTLKSTIEGTLRVALPTLFGVLTTIAAFVSLSQIEGRLGHLYSQFAAIVSICLTLSIIESKLILPAHLAHLKTHITPSKNPLARLWQAVQNSADRGLEFFTDRIYLPLIHHAITHRYAVAALFLAILIAIMSLPFSGVVKMGFFPNIPGETVRAEITMHNDASVGLTERALQRLQASAFEVDHALREQFATQSDTNPTSDKAEAGPKDAAISQASAEESLSDHGGISHVQLLLQSDQSGLVTVELKPDTPYSLPDFTREWKQRVGLLEGAKTIRIQDRRSHVDALRIELRAADDDVLSGAGNALLETLKSFPAVSGIEDNLQPGQPQLHLKLNAQGEALGFTTDQLATQVLQAFNGQVVQRYQRNRDEIEVKVRYPEADRQNPFDVINAKVRTPDGDVVALSSVATITSGYTRETITRIDNQRAVYLSAEMDKDQMDPMVLISQLERDVLPQLKQQYPGLSVHFAGEAQEQAETQSSMEEKFLIALLIIYMLLAIPLKSYTQPVIIMLAIPFGIVGAILGHWMNDLTMSILSFNGIVALSGVVVNDSLLLVSRFNEVRKTTPDLETAIKQAGRDRLRAVLLTSLTTFAGLMPLLSETERQARILIPAAVSISYGILFATVITLILIPTLLLIQHDIRNGFTRAGRWMLMAKGETQPC